MLLKHTVCILAVAAIAVDAKRRKKKKWVGKQVKESVDADAMTEFNKEGLDAIWAAIQTGEHEDMVREFSTGKGTANDEFREFDPAAYDESEFRGLSIQGIMDSGGPQYCRDLFGKKNQKKPKPGQPNYEALIKRYNQCKQLNTIMAARREACTKFMLNTVYNPDRTQDLRPMQASRRDYCRDITRVKDPFVNCKRKCPNTKGGIRCNKAKKACDIKLAEWKDNKAAIQQNKETSDRGGVVCKPLPPGMTMPPKPTKFPPTGKGGKKGKGKKGKKKKRRRGRRSPQPKKKKKNKKDKKKEKEVELPWCPFGIGADGKPKNKKKGVFSNHNREATDPADSEFAQMEALLEQWESEYGIDAIEEEINKANRERGKGKGERSIGGAGGGKYSEVAFESVSEDLRADY